MRSSLTPLTGQGLYLHVTGAAAVSATAAAGSVGSPAARWSMQTPHGASGKREARFEDVYHDQGDDEYDDTDEGGPLPKLTDDPADLAPFIPADKATVLAALRLTGAVPGGSDLKAASEGLHDASEWPDRKPTELAFHGKDDQ